MSVNTSTDTTPNQVIVDTQQRALQPLGEPSYRPEQRTVRVLQITDCHLGKTVGETLVGMDTDASLDYVLSAIQQECADSQFNPELLLVTGDLANHGSLAAYKRLNDKLTPLPLPFLWLPGNHDVLTLMQQAVDPIILSDVVFTASWAIVTLDSTIEGKVGGMIGEDELSRLSRTLERLPQDCFVMVCVHHQVLPVGSAWLDQQQIRDSDALIDVLSAYPQIRLVVSGHVHQDCSRVDARLPQATFITSPSTCIQFAPQTQDFKVDDSQPAYRWFELHADGRFDTGIERVNAADLSIDLESSGY